MKKWLISLTLAVVVGMSSLGSAFATDPSTAHEWWMDMFGAEIPLVSPLESLDLLIAGPGTESCAPLRKSILKGLHDYADMAAHGKGGDAKNIADGVIKLLDFSQKSDCANEALNTYVLGSFFISYNDMIWESSVWLEKDGERPYSIFMQHLRLTDNIMVQYRNVLALALLIHEGRLELLTTSKRNELGGDWQSDNVFGAYDCDNLLISIDPRLRPFDLGATLQHEMNHFLRDQFFSADDIKKSFSYKTSAGTSAGWIGNEISGETPIGLSTTRIRRRKISISVSEKVLLSIYFKSEMRMIPFLIY